VTGGRRRSTYKRSHRNATAAAAPATPPGNLRQLQNGMRRSCCAAWPTGQPQTPPAASPEDQVLAEATPALAYQYTADAVGLTCSTFVQ
jgi:transcriptional regulator with AAA-type ATPase domain